MTPIKFTVKNGITHFHYKISDLMQFARRGFEHGDVGMLLVRREKQMLVYKGFGTIERPIKQINTFSLVHNSLFDGNMLTDEQRLIPPKPIFTKENTRFMFIDFSDAPLIEPKTSYYQK